MIEKPIFLDATLLDAIRAIELTERRIAVVVSRSNELLGTLTDGDIRRYILAGGALESLVEKAMNINPIKAPVDSSDGYLKDLMRGANIIALPLVDSNNKFIRLVHLMDFSNKDKNETYSLLGFSFAVIMAGGEGVRLMPHTIDTPKPMIKVGGIPLIARQVDRLIKAGIRKIYISVNYLAHVIEDYFGDGTNFGAEIFYLREEYKLGTAGALSLLPEKPDGPIIVMNGDILTTSDFQSLFLFHNEHKSNITVGAIDYKINIPYGVIRNSHQHITKLEEKPSERFLCNAGIYAISPKLLDLIPRAEYFDMTDFINYCLDKKIPVSIFPIHEYWSDIGTPNDLEKARAYFSNKELL